MKKKQRQMIGMLLALVVLAAAFLGIRQYNKNASSVTSTTEDTQETVLDVNSDDITSFSYVYEGETYALSLIHIYGRDAFQLDSNRHDQPEALFPDRSDR